MRKFDFFWEQRRKRIILATLLFIMTSNRLIVKIHSIFFVIVVCISLYDELVFIDMYCILISYKLQEAV